MAINEYIPVYLRCSNNNEASTVLDEFLAAVAVYGLPSRVHCDKAGVLFLSTC